MESEIIKLEEELRIAMLTNDVAKLDTLIDESLVFTGPDGSIATKQMDLQAHRSGIQKISKLEQSEERIQTYDNFSVVNVKMNLEGSYGEFPITGKYRYTRVWTKINNEWKIIAGSVVKISN